MRFPCVHPVVIPPDRPDLDLEQVDRRAEAVDHLLFDDVVPRVTQETVPVRSVVGLKGRGHHRPPQPRWAGRALVDGLAPGRRIAMGPAGYAWLPARHCTGFLSKYKVIYS